MNHIHKQTDFRTEWEFKSASEIKLWDQQQKHSESLNPKRGVTQSDHCALVKFAAVASCKKIPSTPRGLEGSDVLRNSVTEATEGE